MLSLIRSSLLLGAMVCASALNMAVTPAHASIITWDLSGPNVALGTSQTFTAGGFTITAAGFTNPTFSTGVNLYEKNLGGDEKGLGLVNDPSGDHEITGTNLIRIDLGANHLTDFSFSPNSLNQGEEFNLFGSNSPTSNYKLVSTGHLEGDHTLTGADGSFEYYYIQDKQVYGIPSNNLLLASVDAMSPAVPEASTWAMMLLGFAAVGLSAYRCKRRDSVQLRFA